MGIKDIVNDYKYPILALAFLLIVYGFFLQTNNAGAPKLTGYATVGPVSLSTPKAASCSSATVSWGLPSFYPTGVTIYYIVEYSLSSGFPQNPDYSSTLSPTTSKSATIKGLAPGVPYYIRVYSYPSNNAYAGSYSSYKSITLTCKPQSLTPTNVDCHQEKITWIAPAIGGASGYIVAISTASNFVPYSLYTTTSTSYTFTGLNGGTTYWARVSGGASINSKMYYDSAGTIPTVSFTTPQCTTSMPAPTNLNAQVKDCSTVYFSWGSVANAGGYILYYDTKSDFSTGTSVMISAASPYYTVTGLKAGSYYYWKVYVWNVNDFYNGATSTVQTTGTLPACSTMPAPTNLVAQIKDCSTVYFSWGSVANAGGYILTYDTKSDFSTAISVMLSATTNYYTATGLKAGSYYYWKVYVWNVNDFYNGATSTVQTTGTLPACAQVTAPTNLKATPNPASCSMDFSWTPSNAANYRIDIAFSKTELEESVRAYIFPSKIATGSGYSWPGLKSMIYYWRIYAYSGDVWSGNGVFTPTQGPIILSCADLSPINPSSGLIYSDESKLIKLINARRAAAGITQLAADNGVINKVAEERAMEIFIYGFTHGPPGNPYFDKDLKREGITNVYAGENLGTTNNGDDPAGFVFSGAEHSFCNSVEHDANQMNPTYNTVGVGESVGLKPASLPYNFAVIFIQR